jgi:RNA polymerase sigma-70 factor (ECF subfamily)
VLILREVLCWRAGEVAELLDTTVASVNSALQRARSTLCATMDVATSPAPPTDTPRRMLFARYITAFERYDLDSLTTIVHEDALASVRA